ncbi:MAG: DUF1080 domain-containing protein [Planctomycetia bacterium]|nr:DUF1080 domain-containing protein [Planctomycetia bacterium]
MPPSLPAAVRSLLAIAVLSAIAGTAAVPAANPAYVDPAKTDDDFPFQGEYAGTVHLGGQEVNVGAQVIARGDGGFDTVAYPGGLPGDGWTPPNKITGTGSREGVGKDARVKLEGVDQDGVTRRAELRPVGDGFELVALSEDGGVAARLPRVSRRSPTLGQKPPENALVLFDGTSADRFADGRVSGDGLLMEGTTSKDVFGDARWHIEFRLPYQPRDRGQARGNSGVYLQGAYEVQVLDSFGLEGRNNECGGVYSVAAPAVNMCYPPLAWQTYDIDFTAPRFEGDKKVANPRMTVRHNGVVIHDDVEVPRITPGGPQTVEKPLGPLYLQNHGNPVRYRNIWVLPKP